MNQSGLPLHFKQKKLGKLKKKRNRCLYKFVEKKRKKRKKKFVAIQPILLNFGPLNIWTCENNCLRVLCILKFASIRNTFLFLNFRNSGWGCCNRKKTANYCIYDKKSSFQSCVKLKKSYCFRLSLLFFRS